MNNVYLIGMYYNEDSDNDFCVLGVASIQEKAEAMFNYYKKEDFENEFRYEIRMWNVDVVDPILEIQAKTISVDGVELTMHSPIKNYKVIKSDLY